MSKCFAYRIELSLRTKSVNQQSSQSTTRQCCVPLISEKSVYVYKNIQEDEPFEYILSFPIKGCMFNFQSISITPMKGKYLLQSEYVMVRNEIHDVSLNQKESTSPNEKQPPVNILQKHHAVDYIFHDWPSSPSVFTFKIIFCKHTEEMYCDKWWFSWQASLFFSDFHVCLPSPFGDFYVLIDIKALIEDLWRYLCDF